MRTITPSTFWVGTLAWITLASACGPAFSQSDVTFKQHEGHLDISIEGKPFATYVWNDSQILRPHFKTIHAPSGEVVTRNSPPVEGQDAMDHATMHPGLWMAFGDVSGQDFWRNKVQVKHAKFVTEPTSSGKAGRFAVQNIYVSADRWAVCQELCQIQISVEPSGYLIDWRSEFTHDSAFSFGDQEEMGLGIRMATPLTVKNGGEMLNSNGQRNEKEVWGKAADWCDYHGGKDHPVGILVMADPSNFRRSWFHARDYGLLVANPFGQNAFKQGPKSLIEVKKGEKFKLHFGVLVHGDQPDLNAAYKAWSASKN